MSNIAQIPFRLWSHFAQTIYSWAISIFLFRLHFRVALDKHLTLWHPAVAFERLFTI